MMSPVNSLKFLPLAVCWDLRVGLVIDSVVWVMFWFSWGFQTLCISAFSVLWLIVTYSSSTWPEVVVITTVYRSPEGPAWRMMGVCDLLTTAQDWDNGFFRLHKLLEQGQNLIFPLQILPENQKYNFLLNLVTFYKAGLQISDVSKKLKSFCQRHL